MLKVIRISSSPLKGETGIKTITISVLFLITLLINGCSGVIAINSLRLPPVSTIEGVVSQLEESGFILTDSSGSIFVRARLADNKKLKLSKGEKIKVYGNLQGGQDRVYDGYVIKKMSGEQVIVTNPSPHFGFIIQSSFK